MFLILEGPDCVGKTTMAAALGEIFGAPVEKHIYPKDEQELHSKVDAMLAREEMPSVIFDRWYFPSDIIYSPIILKKPSPLKKREDEIIEWLLKVKATILYMHAPLDIVQYRYEEVAEKDDYIKRDNLSTLVEEYHKYMRELQSKEVHIIDVSSMEREWLTINFAAQSILNHRLRRYMQERFPEALKPVWIGRR